VSTGEAQAAVKKLGLLPNAVTVIPNIIPVQEVITIAEKQSALDVQAPRRLILSVGRLVAYKRTDRIIAALPYLPANYTLALIGEGPERMALQKLATRLGVHDRVQFLGAVTDDELRRWYLHARAVVSLSTGEAFGRVVVEALGANCQVVCSDIPAFRDFHAEFPCAVSLVSQKMHDNEVAEVLRAAAMRPGPVSVDLRRYAWDAIATKLVNIYESVAAKN
jgi:glycosyltransferase involved in cell wall biosynthesis